MMVLAVTSCFFFNDTATTEIYTLSLHDALPISRERTRSGSDGAAAIGSSASRRVCFSLLSISLRSEEHTSELQSRQYLVCRLLLEKKKYILHQCFYISQRPSHTVHLELRRLLTS